MVWKVYFFIILALDYLQASNAKRRYPLEDEEVIERRDYRPTKWMTNSALDVWFGNKSFIEVIAREFNYFVKGIAKRPARSIKDTSANAIGMKNQCTDFKSTNKTTQDTNRKERHLNATYNVADGKEERITQTGDDQKHMNHTFKRGNSKTGQNVINKEDWEGLDESVEGSRKETVIKETKSKKVETPAEEHFEDSRFDIILELKRKEIDEAILKRLTEEMKVVFESCWKEVLTNNTSFYNNTNTIGEKIFLNCTSILPGNFPHKFIVPKIHQAIKNLGKKLSYTFLILTTYPRKPDNKNLEDDNEEEENEKNKSNQNASDESEIETYTVTTESDF